MDYEEAQGSNSHVTYMGLLSFKRDRKHVIASVVYKHIFDVCYSMIYQQIIIISTENKT